MSYEPVFENYLWEDEEKWLRWNARHSKLVRQVEAMIKVKERYDERR